MFHGIHKCSPEVAHFSRIIAGMMNFFCYGYLWKAYMADEDCGHLTKLVLAYLIVMTFGFSCFLLAIIYSISCIGVLFFHDWSLPGLGASDNLTIFIGNHQNNQSESISHEYALGGVDFF